MIYETFHDMKKLLLFLVFILAVSCSAPDQEQRFGEYTVKIIDSCEYLCRTSGYSGYMAHKGNCKHCAEIRQRENNELVKRIEELIKY